MRVCLKNFAYHILKSVLPKHNAMHSSKHTTQKVSFRTEFSKSVVPNMKLCVLPNIVLMFEYLPTKYTNSNSIVIYPSYLDPFKSQISPDSSHPQRTIILGAIGAHICKFVKICGWRSKVPSVTDSYGPAMTRTLEILFATHFQKLAKNVYNSLVQLLPKVIYPKYSKHWPHPQLIMDAVKCRIMVEIIFFSFTFQAYTLPHTSNGICVSLFKFHTWILKQF